MGGYLLVVEVNTKYFFYNITHILPWFLPSSGQKGGDVLENSQGSGRGMYWFWASSSLWSEIAWNIELKVRADIGSSF